MAIQVLGSLCVGVAHQPNKAMQKEIAGTEALSLLINFMQKSRNLLIQVSRYLSLRQLLCLSRKTRIRAHSGMLGISAF